MSIDFEIQSLFVSGGIRGSASLAFAIDHTQPQARLLVEVNRHRDNFVLVQAFYFDSAQTWQMVLNSDWMPTPLKAFHLEVERTSAPSLSVSLTDTGGAKLFEGSTTPLPTEEL